MTAKLADIAWPGPRPLSFDGDLRERSLAGREEELEELLDVCQTYAVVEITAASGVGKTSFVAAARPYLEEGGARVVKTLPWGEVIARYENLSPAVVEAQDPVPLYLLALGQPLGMEADDLPGLLDELGGRKPLVCIFDQLEELLRYWPRLGGNLLELLAHTAVTAGVPHVIIARSEYRDLPRPAEIREAPTWHIYLRELFEPDVIRRIVEDPVPPGVELEEGVSERLVDWWQQARAGSTANRLTDGGLRRAASEYGLLHLQALLWSVRRWTSASPDADQQRLRLGDLDAYRADRSLPAGVPTGEALVEDAMRTYVEASIASCDANLWPNGPRMMLARAASHLSSGGFKSAQSVAALAARTILEELGSSRSSRDFRLSLGGSADGLRGGIDEFAKRYQVEGAGIADGMKGWQVAEEMISSLERVLEKLADEGDANLLRRYQHRGEVIYELVHDGVAPALDSWADAVLESPIASLGGISARRGEMVSFDLAPETFLDGDSVRLYWSAVEPVERRGRPAAAIDNLKWYGLGVHSPEATSREGQAPVRIDGIVFQDCEMRGVAIVDCTFDDVSFERCNLVGAAFKKSVFREVAFDCAGMPGGMNYVAIEGARPGAQVEFRNLESATGLFLTGLEGGTWVFRDAELAHCLVGSDEADLTLRLDGATSLSHATLDLVAGATVEAAPEARAMLLTRGPVDVPAHLLDGDAGIPG